MSQNNSNTKVKQESKSRFHRTGQVVKILRIQMNLTQAEFAKLLGMDKESSGSQYVSNCERGICELPVYAVKKLLKNTKVVEIASGNFKNKLLKAHALDEADHYLKKIESK